MLTNFKRCRFCGFDLEFTKCPGVAVPIACEMVRITKTQLVKENSETIVVLLRDIQKHLSEPVLQEMSVEELARYLVEREEVLRARLDRLLFNLGELE